MISEKTEGKTPKKKCCPAKTAANSYYKLDGIMEMIAKYVTALSAIKRETSSSE
jgi:hypothetical protein